LGENQNTVLADNKQTVY